MISAILFVLGWIGAAIGWIGVWVTRRHVAEGRRLLLALQAERTRLELERQWLATAREFFPEPRS